MKPGLPAWALTTAEPGDRLAARTAQQRGVLQVRWKSGATPRKWARRQGWPTPWLGFERAFVARMLASDGDFGAALAESGIEVVLPRAHHTLSGDDLASLDAAYAAGGRAWRSLVDELREIRRAVEAGVVVQVEEARLWSFQSFYDWAHGRYYRLEDDIGTGWIGSDEPHP